ncbi:sigma-70 family RNA polymerase sigma factor [Spongiactinospora sp. TRM90649]|uniref:RNA polymerase sigma factor n=1 Tax=Spongiactinospora sp. TRM90649 TaxID=3031114 RepID=UPI0023F84B9D|nr:sigma-70 family RNA polymerase sigma factor [Spongiactinospora sp. TRM90649]MDF5754294.1 sigma-70 family RNA polymerase sigma factor [Spongiactinospora sp. TRM90649]
MGAGEAAERLVREEGTRVLATLIRVTGDIDLAQDAVQDAVVRALERWPRDGVPPNPRAWLTVTAKRRAIDLLRRESGRTGKEVQATMSLDVEPEPAEVVRDDLLRLMFTCCHPALSPETRVALALRTLGGLSTADIARALLVPEATMAKRLTRAKQKILRARIPYRVPGAEELPARLAGVAATIYLIYNEGYTAGPGADLLRVALSEEAIRLARRLAELMPDEAAALGLLALLSLHDARRPARLDAEGRVVPLADQDRSLWDAARIREGVTLAGAALRRAPRRPDAYAVQAAIAACHALAPSYADTDWDAVVSWYDVLLTVHDTPVTRLNRAAAVAERDGPRAALALVEAIDGLDGYPWWHASRAELLHRLGRPEPAAEALHQAIATGLNEPLAEHLRRRLDDPAD